VKEIVILMEYAKKIKKEVMPIANVTSLSMAIFVINVKLLILLNY
jgi:hypothetical protein